jgi:hypothetical protein
MTFFDLGVSEKDAHAVDYMADTNRLLIKLFLDENKTRKLTKAKMAGALGVDKSVITKMLKGNANLTERKVGELLWALGYRLEQTPVRICDGNEDIDTGKMELKVYTTGKNPPTNTQTSTSKNYSVFHGV